MSVDNNLLHVSICIRILSASISVFMGYGSLDQGSKSLISEYAFYKVIKHNCFLMLILFETHFSVLIIYSNTTNITQV